MAARRRASGRGPPIPPPDSSSRGTASDPQRFPPPKPGGRRPPPNPGGGAGWWRPASSRPNAARARLGESGTGHDSRRISAALLAGPGSTRSPGRVPAPSRPRPPTPARPPRPSRRSRRLRRFPHQAAKAQVVVGRHQRAPRRAVGGAHRSHLQGWGRLGRLASANRGRVGMQAATRPDGRTRGEGDRPFPLPIKRFHNYDEIVACACGHY